MIGNIHNNLTILEILPSRRSGKNMYRFVKCSCRCGGEIITRMGRVTQGVTKSCGCYRKNPKDHGLYHSMRSEHSVWAGMLSRCSNPNNKQYKDYGGRGIKVSEDWNHFENFVGDMGRRPSSSHSIERLNNNGDYCKENCSWELRVVQANNKRNNHVIEWNGKTQTLAQWSRELGIGYDILHDRIKRYRLPIEKAFTNPVIKRPK